MKCINKKQIISIIFLLLIITLCGCTKEEEPLIRDYENTEYNKSLYRGELFAQDLAVATEDVCLTDYTLSNPDYYAAGLFDVNQEIVYHGYSLHEKIYPASTTKVLTAYVALKYGNMDDIVTVSEYAVDLPSDSQMCGLRAGDTATLYDLMNGLMLHSGNDAAIAIAEHVAGSEAAFVDMMNEEALLMGASNSHFMNPHGLHDDDHYVTAYDLYIIFNECIKNPEFLEIISKYNYTANVTSANGTVVPMTWNSTIRYKSGRAEAPSNVTIIGGKTGTTNLARSCVIILEEDELENKYISMIMGADGATYLYDEMTPLIESIPATT